MMLLTNLKISNAVCLQLGGTLVQSTFWIKVIAPTDGENLFQIICDKIRMKKNRSGVKHVRKIYHPNIFENFSDCLISHFFYGA